MGSSFTDKPDPEDDDDEDGDMDRAILVAASDRQYLYPNL